MKNRVAVENANCHEKYRVAVEMQTVMKNIEWLWKSELS